MFFSLIWTVELKDSLVGIGYFAAIIFMYFASRLLIDSNDTNQTKVVRNIIIAGWIIFGECIFMLISRLSEGFNLNDILHWKILNFIWLHQNLYTAFTNICILLCVYYFIKNKDFEKKLFSMISIMLFIIVEALTVCRAGILTLALTLPVALIIYIINIKKNGWDSKKSDLFFITCSFLIIIAGTILIIKKGYIEDFVRHFKEFPFSYENGRGLVYGTAIEQFLKHPILGTGVNTARYYLFEFYNYHNYFMQILATCGIMGLIPFSCFLFYSIKRFKQNNIYCIFVGVITLYFVIHGTLDTLYFNYSIMPILMVLLALIYERPLVLDSNECEVTIMDNELSSNPNGDTEEIKIKNGFFYLLFKRTFDIISSGLFLILFSWLILILLFIKFCEDGHNPVYTSIRVGKNGKPIKFHKIRSMKPNADKLKQQLIDQGLNEADGPLFKMKNDPRITRFGKFLRKTSLDELLQIWDIFVGRISVVGPRSPLPKEFEQFNDRAKHKVDVKGGLLCLWQIQHNRNALSFDESIELDIKYIETRSLWLDFKIICKGFWMVIFDHSGE